jgi:hypothetical protein
MSSNFGFEEVVNVPPHETHDIGSNDYFNWGPGAENEDFNLMSIFQGIKRFRKPTL